MKNFFLSSLVIAAIVVSAAFVYPSSELRSGMSEITIVGYGKANNSVENISTVDAIKFADVEVKPMFEGGEPDVTFRKWVVQKIIYPPIAQENNVTGTVVADLIIGTDGKITGISIRSTPNPLLDVEIMRLLLQSPKWTAGQQNGKTVSVSYEFRFNFILQ